MRIVVTSDGPGLDSPTDPHFGRCPLFVFVDTETLACEAAANPAAESAHGAGIQAAQFIVEQDAQAVLTGRVGPNAFEVLEAAGVAVYALTDGGTVRQAVEAFRAGRLQALTTPNSAGHSGLGGGTRR